MIDLKCPVCGGVVTYKLMPDYKGNLVEITCRDCGGRKWHSLLTGIIPPEVNRTKKGFKINLVDL